MVTSTVPALLAAASLALLAIGLLPSSPKLSSHVSRSVATPRVALRTAFGAASPTGLRGCDGRVTWRGKIARVEPSRAYYSMGGLRKNILASHASVMPSVIIGGGRVGEALKEMGSGDDVIMGRYDDFPENITSGPIYVATRNDALDDVIERVPEDRREDLVFMQNGMLEPYLESKGLADKATQVLVYFAVAKLGEKPTDGITDMNPEGLTAANGKWAEEASNRFNNVGLSCKVLDKKPFMAAMFEKLIWICSFMVIGAMHAPCTVGGVETNHTEEVTALINEMAAAVPDVEFEPQLPERLLAYARSVAHFPTAVKEFEWRNGFFNNLSKQAYKKGIMKDPLPLHSYYLNVLGVGKPIPFPFQNYKSFMTQEEEEAQHELLTRFEAKRARRLARRARKKAEAEEMKKRELEKAESAKKEMELKEEQMTKARQLEMAKAAAEEETKRSRRKAGTAANPI